MEKVGARVWLVPVALLAVYIFWGGTYLAMRLAVETIPPLLMAGTRFLTAGTLMFLLAMRQGTPWPKKEHWGHATVAGTLLLAFGNGGVVLAEQTVPSGLAALLVATGPIWMVLLNWLWLKDSRPHWIAWAGIGLGLAGIALLAGGGDTLLGAGAISPFWAIILTITSFSWSLGSLYTRQAPRPDSAIQATAMQMLTGGALLIAMGTLTGEWMRLDLYAITAKSLCSFLYLLVFGSLVGFSAYVWLMQNASPILVATHSYVNPIVAVFLGALIAGEDLTGRVLISALVIVVSVILLTASLRRPVRQVTKAACPESRVSE